jgi:hypothetical protein
MRTEVTRLVGDRPERWWDGTSWFHFRERRLARDEVNTGEVEVLRFRASRVWAMHSFEGSPCCPNQWLIETDDGSLVWLSSWELFHAAEGVFPGEQLTVQRWPQTKRVASAAVTGTAIPFVAFDTELATRVRDVLKSERADDWLRCHVLPTGSVVLPGRGDGA